MSADIRFMLRALQLAEKGRYSTQPNPRVGCVIVKNGQIVGEGYHRCAGEGHAEVNALKMAGDQAIGADVYVTLEPCSHQGRTPPCADALIHAKVNRVIAAMQDPNPLVAGKGLERLQAHGIETSFGMGQNEARQLNRGYLKRMQSAKPFVILKMASSLDGRIAMKSGESAWITSSAARKDVHRMRLESCAVVTGMNTVMVDNPRFTVRLDSDDIDPNYHLSDRQPIRVVLDRQARLSDAAAICQQAGETWQMIGEDIENKPAAPANRQVSLKLKQGKLDLHALLSYLGEQAINNVMIEAGGTLAASFIREGLVDELVVYQSPDMMGSSAQAMFQLPEILKMNEKISFEYQDMRKIGRDLKLTLTSAN